MKLNVKAMAISVALIWGGSIFLVALINRFCSYSYGLIFLKVMGSVYPGFQGASGMKDGLVGTGYALLDGAVGGALFAWVYNRFAK